MNLKREPAVIIGAAEALAIALIGIVAFAPAIVLLGAVATRSRVTPVE